MFVGHYSVALAGKVAGPGVPLWVLLLAAQFVDVLWTLFVLLGIEQVRLDPALASNPLDLHHMPYTHSLLGTALWAGVAGLLAARIAWLGGTLRAGILVGLVVLSHWPLDLLVHRPDLTLWGAPPKLGLGLWNAPFVAWLLELVLLGAAAAFWASRGALSARSRRMLAGGVAALAALQTAVVLGPIPGSVSVLALLLLAVFVLVPGAGRWMEHRIGRPGAAAAQAAAAFRNAGRASRRAR